MRSLAKVITGLLILGAVCYAQDIETRKLSDNVLVLSGRGGNVTAIATGEGLVVIDSFISPAAADQARKLISDFSSEKFRYLINTHLNSNTPSGTRFSRILSSSANRTADGG